MSLLQKVPANKLQWIAVALLVIYPLSIIAARLEIWHFRNSFLLLIVAALVSFIVLVLSVLKLGQGQHSDAKPLIVALICTLTPLAVMGNSVFKAQSSPFIHDIVTDTANPPEFVAAKQARVEGDHDVTYAGKEVADLQLAGYPDLKPLVLQQAASQVFDDAKVAMLANGWTILAENNQKLPYTLEAVDSSLLFGFKDDVIVRIAQSLTSEDSEAVTTTVDVRSMSRQGKSDMGANAKRITKLLDQLQK